MSTALAPLFTWRSAVASEHGPASPVTRHVLLTLSLYMNERGGSCFPSYDELQLATGLGREALARHLREAREDGWLTVARVGLAGQRWARNEYRSAVPKGVTKAVREANRLAQEGSSGGEPALRERQFVSEAKAVREANSITPVTLQRNTNAGSARTREDRILNPNPTPQAPAVQVYTELVGHPPFLHFGELIAQRVGEDAARLAGWRDVLAVWAATNAPGRVGKTYNLDNVPGLLDALDEKIGARKNGRSAVAPKARPAGALTFAEVMDAVDADPDFQYEPHPEDAALYRRING